MEEYELVSDTEPDRAQHPTLKLTSRVSSGGTRSGATPGPQQQQPRRYRTPNPYQPGGTGPPSPAFQRRKSRDETKKEIQDDDEATLRELLIRYIYQL